jgi:3-oxoacyl-(acyl-carrier-protein) synthase
MSRILKITITAAMQCLKEAGINTPDAIIIGTGRGAVTDMEQFVKDMIRLEEGALNPTLFIQSTYNSPNGWIAMQSACTGYNQTYVHRGCSFELALQDAQMMLADASGPLFLLTGCYDEITEEYYLIRSKRNYWKKNPPDSRKLFEHADTSGTIGGEGAAFFTLSNEQGPAHAMITDLRIVYRATPGSLRENVVHLLDDAGLLPTDISVVLSGLNGDLVQSELYRESLALFPDDICLAAFKHLCGEYDTSTGFAVWLAQYILHQKYVPAATLIKNKPPNFIRHILLINHYIHGTASILLISPTNQ